MSQSTSLRLGDTDKPRAWHRLLHHDIEQLWLRTTFKCSKISRKGTRRGTLERLVQSVHDGILKRDLSKVEAARSDDILFSKVVCSHAPSAVRCILSILPGLVVYLVLYEVWLNYIVSTLPGSFLVGNYNIECCKTSVVPCRLTDEINEKLESPRLIPNCDRQIGSLETWTISYSPFSSVPPKHLTPICLWTLFSNPLGNPPDRKSADLSLY